VYKQGYASEIPLIGTYRSLGLPEALTTWRPPPGDVTLKAKGTAYMVTPINGVNSTITWDAVDVVYPPTQPNAIFLTTNVQITDGQTRNTCEDPVSS